MAATYKCPCSSCGTNIEFPEEYLGQQASCPSCGNSTLLAIAPVAPTPPRPSPPPPPRPASPAPPSAARPAPKLTLSNKTKPTDPSAPPPAPRAAATPWAGKSDRYLDALEKSAAHEQGRDESKGNQGRSWILISAAVLTALAGLFWVGLGVLQGVVPLFANGQVPWKEIFQNMMIGGLIVGLGVGLFMRNSSCYQWGVATHLINILWVVYQIFDAQFYLGILAVLLHGAAALAMVMSRDEFPSE